MFAQIEDYEINTGCVSSRVAQVRLSGDIQYNDFEATLFSLTDVLAQIGGIFNVLYSIGFVVCAVYSYRLFYASMMRKLFTFANQSGEERRRRRFQDFENEMIGPENDDNEDNEDNDDQRGSKKASLPLHKIFSS